MAEVWFSKRVAYIIPRVHEASISELGDIIITLYVKIADLLLIFSEVAESSGS